MTRPILFNTEMVKAILDGRKTVTRRIIKHNVDAILHSPYHDGHPEVSDKALIEKLCNSPYRPGDILYIRETWYEDGYRFMYRADYSCTEIFFKGGHEVKLKWHPSIHMPKEAARIWLKVTDVRVERLQDITEDGAKAEGAKQCYEQINTIENKPVTYLAEDRKGYYVLGFKSVWNSTIKKSDIDRYGWAANPFVWVIEFERCEKPEE